MDADSLISTITSFSSAPPSNLKEPQRTALLEACVRMQRVLETPMEATTHIMLAPQNSAAVRIASDMRFFDFASKANGIVTVEELAEASHADPTLVRRILRILSNIAVFKEVGVDQYSAEPIANAWTTGSPFQAMVVYLSSAAPGLAKLPDYFKEKGYHNPTNTYDGPWQYAEKTKLHYFAWLATKPHYQAAFNTIMSMLLSVDLDPWYSYYPVTEKLAQSSQVENSGPLIVDVGGGLGTSLINFRNHFSQLKGRLVLFDLPHVIDAIDMSSLYPNIEAFAHDFFEVPPEHVHDAQFYFLRNVLHDWPDIQAGIILKHVREATGPNSVILINELILPESEVSVSIVRTDTQMMACSAGMERTEVQWKKLLENAGFKVTGIWHRDSGRGLIEAAVG